MDVYLFYGILLILFIGFLVQGQRASKHGRADVGPRPGYEAQAAGVIVLVVVLVAYELLIGRRLERIDGWPNVIWLVSDLLSFGLAMLAGWLVERYIVRRAHPE